MRVMLDTNVLISLLLFPAKRMNAMMECIFTEHKLVLSSFVVNELKAVVKRKFPGKDAVVNKLLLEMSYDLVNTPDTLNEIPFQIRDPNDYPVLSAAIVHNVDVFITGDKDFLDVCVEKPEILTPAGFIAKYLPPSTY